MFFSSISVLFPFTLICLCHSSVTFCSMILGSCSIIVKILDLISLSFNAVNPWMNIKHLNMSIERLPYLNYFHCLHKFSFSCFSMCKHPYQVWNKWSLLLKMPDKIFIVSLNEISSGFLGQIKFVYLVFSFVPNFCSNRVIFFFIRPLFTSFSKNHLISMKIGGKDYSIFQVILDNEFNIPSVEKI